MNKPTKRFGVLAILTVSCIVAVLVQTRHRRTDKSDKFPSGDLVAIATAISNSGHYWRHFPAAFGKRDVALTSWRVELLAFLETTAFYDGYDFESPWNSIGNQNHLENLNQEAFKYRGRVSYRHFCGNSRNQMNTRFLLLVDSIPIEFRIGPLEFGKTPKIGIFGTYHGKVVLLEVSESDVHWMEPVDYTIERFRENNELLNDIVGSAEIEGEYIEYFDRAQTVQKLQAEMAIKD